MTLVNVLTKKSKLYLAFYSLIRTFAGMKERKRRMPAEWEPQSMVQLTWPHKDTDWAPILPEITSVYEQMAHEIKKREPLLIVDDIPHNDTWARDHGFITVEASPDPSDILQQQQPHSQLTIEGIDSDLRSRSSIVS